MHKFLSQDISFRFLVLYLFALGSFVSCNNRDTKDKHPQARMGAESSLFVDEGSITGYADSIDLNLSDYEKRESLVFKKEDYSFYVTRYSSNGSPVLYIERGNGDIGSVEKYYYIDDQQLLLYKESTANSYQSPHYRSRREYYRNNVLFYADEKHADNSAALKTAKYGEIQGTRRNAAEIFSYMESAINTEGEFDLTFEGITEYPKARYIILSKNELKSYRAVIRVEDEDELIHELATNTDKYKGSSLNIKWEIKDGEALYLNGALK